MSTDKTIWETVSDTLIEANIDVYPPAIKTDECTAPYAVLKEDGAAQISTFSSEYHYYTLMCYVPKDTYTELARYVKQCKDVISSQLFPLLMPTGLETPAFFDDTVKAHMISVQYRNNVRNIHL